MSRIHEKPNSDEDRLSWMIEYPERAQFLLDLATTEEDVEKRQTRVRYVIDEQLEKERVDIQES